MRYWISAFALGASLGTAHAATLDQPQAKALAQEAYVFAYATVEHDKVLSAIAALHYDADGGLTLILQSAAPTQQQGNWLPTPQGPFNLLLRLYLPKAGALDGSYQLPTIARIEP